MVFDYGGTLNQRADEDGAVDSAAAESIRLLHDRGVTKMLASNTAPTTPSRYVALANAGIIGCFDHILLSEELGFAKPAPYFYARVLAVAACPPEAVVWVGNRLDKDVLGPIAFGSRAVLVDAAGTEGTPPAGVSVVRHVAELPALLDTWAGRQAAP